MREVLLIEDDTELRESTAMVINQLDQFRCAVHCDWTTWHSWTCDTKRVQVAIASIHKFDRSTQSRLRELRRGIPASEVIVLCERATLSCLRGLLALGIGSVVLKGSTAYDLSMAVTGVWDADNSGNNGKGTYDSEKWAVVSKYFSVSIADGMHFSFKNHREQELVLASVLGSIAPLMAIPNSPPGSGAAVERRCPKVMVRHAARPVAGPCS